MAAAGTFIDPLIKAITDGDLRTVNTLLDNPEIDRSLNPKKFIDETGIRILSWHNMINSMKLFG